MGTSIGLVLVASLGLGVLQLGKTDVGMSYDFSGLAAITIPGLMVAFIMSIGISELEDFELMARPTPQLITVATVFAATLVATLTMAYATDQWTASWAEYGSTEVTRNFFIFLGIGLVPALWQQWKIAPYLVAGVTIMITGVFGISRSASPLFWPTQLVQTQTELWASGGVCAVTAMLIVWRSRGCGSGSG
jgi:hypothetical protein